MSRWKARKPLLHLSTRRSRVVFKDRLRKRGETIGELEIGNTASGPSITSVPMPRATCRVIDSLWSRDRVTRSIEPHNFLIIEKARITVQTRSSISLQMTIDPHFLPPPPFFTFPSFYSRVCSSDRNSFDLLVHCHSRRIFVSVCYLFFSLLHISIFLLNFF